MTPKRDSVGGHGAGLASKAISPSGFHCTVGHMTSSAAVVARAPDEILGAAAAAFVGHGSNRMLAGQEHERQLVVHHELPVG
jgi:hypothetical protein